jgi:hypothetical protein
VHGKQERVQATGNYPEVAVRFEYATLAPPNSAEDCSFPAVGLRVRLDP